MARTKKQTTTYNGFAFPLQPDTELGLAMLIAEDEEGHHAPVAVASTINEAKEIAESDLRSFMEVQVGQPIVAPIVAAAGFQPALFASPRRD